MLNHFFPNQNDILGESWSALGSMLSGTYIETPKEQTHAPLGARHDEPLEALRVDVPLGCMVLFTFYWRHRGKGDVPTGSAQPPVHLRPHIYAYSHDPRKMPTVDFETYLEFTSVCSHRGAREDPCSGLQVMECLQTFDKFFVFGHEEDMKPFHTCFSTQLELDEWVRSARNLQQIPRVRVKSGAPVQVCEWKMWCVRPGNDKGPPKLGETATVWLSGKHDVDGGSDVKVSLSKADFSNPSPLFHGKDGKRYALTGDAAPWHSFTHSSMVPTHAGLSLPDDVKDLNDQLSSMVMEAFTNMISNWCSSTLYDVVSLLYVQILPKPAVLQLGQHRVLQANYNGTIIPLIPSFQKVGKYRLYTTRDKGLKVLLLKVEEDPRIYHVSIQRPKPHQEQ